MPQVFASDAEVNIVTLQCHDGKTQTTKTNLKEKKKCLIGLEKREVYHALINMYCFEFAVILKEWRFIDLLHMKHILT
jgi:predicted glycosyltransferase